MYYITAEYNTLQFIAIFYLEPLFIYQCFWSSYWRLWSRWTNRLSTREGSSCARWENSKARSYQSIEIWEPVTCVISIQCFNKNVTDTSEVGLKRFNGESIWIALASMVVKRNPSFVGETFLLAMNLDLTVGEIQEL